MATGNKDALNNIKSKLMAMGFGSITHIGEPRSGQTKMLAIVPQGGDIDETTLNAPREIHRVIIRFYINWMEQGQEETEFELDQFRADIEEDVFGDFDLGGKVAYALPTEFRWDYGERTVGTVLYRTVDLTIAYRLDDNAAFAA